MVNFTRALETAGEFAGVPEMQVQALLIKESGILGPELKAAARAYLSDDADTTLRWAREANPVVQRAARAEVGDLPTDSYSLRLSGIAKIKTSDGLLGMTDWTPSSWPT